MSKFAVGDRVAALANTEWDEDLTVLNESELAYMKLHGHHGHIVDHCGRTGCLHDLHVHWEGVHDGRRPGPTSWTDGYIWHVDDDEIEHID